MFKCLKHNYNNLCIFGSLRAHGVNNQRRANGQVFILDIPTEHGRPLAQRSEQTSLTLHPPRMRVQQIAPSLPSAPST